MGRMVVEHRRKQSLRARRSEFSDRPGQTAAVHRLRALQRLGQDAPTLAAAFTGRLASPGRLKPMEQLVRLTNSKSLEMLLTL
ncbi:MAG TPA: hypothetical protein VGU01_05875 [Sphingomicrobium sp.]|nr:hypothetical protein [Sphingomicrobium sp.]